MFATGKGRSDPPFDDRAGSRWATRLGASALTLLLGCSSGPSMAFLYGSPLPIERLSRYSHVVVEPENTTDRELRALRAAGAQVYAYVSVGEADPARPWHGELQPSWFLGHNPSWGTYVLDQSHPEWRRYLIERRVAPLRSRGFDGLFLDTLDSYRLIKGGQPAQAAQRAGLVETIRALGVRYPGLKLLLNRGFELLPQVADLCTGVVAESLFQTFDSASKRYRPVDEAERAALLQLLAEARERHGLMVTVIDYVSPDDEELARETARRIARLGYLPWVTSWNLMSLGIGQADLSLYGP